MKLPIVVDLDSGYGDPVKAFHVVEAMARAGVGHLRLVVAWPFPAKRMRELAETVKVFIMPELNMGQMVLEIERAVAGAARVVSLPHAGGSVHEPETILAAILEAGR